MRAGAAPVVTAKARTSAREVALAVVRDVFGAEARGAQAAFDHRARRAVLDARDRAFAAELAYGSIKQRRLIDWYLAPYLAGREKPLAPTVAEILRLGVYQLRFMSGVEDYAALSQTVNLAWQYGHKGIAGLVNAVLRRMQADGPRNLQRDDFESEADFLGTKYSVPTWLATQYLGALGERAETALHGVNRAPRAAIRVNAARACIDTVRAELATRGVTTQPSPYVAQTLLVDGGVVEDDPDGRWSLQGEAAAMPVDLLSPQPGETVLEFCSGRGNKTLQTAERLADSGRIVCIERDAAKMAALAAALERSGKASANAECSAQVATVLGDALDAPDVQADAVLLDAPCSGTGVIGRHPEARWRKRPDDGARLAATQRALLAAAAARTKPDGRLAYSVCSLDGREGRDVVAAFLTETPAFSRAPIPERYGAFEDRGDIVVPPGIDGRDGFYIASLRRHAGETPP